MIYHLGGNYMKGYEEYTPENLSVYEYLKRETASYTDQPAIKFYGKVFTYSQMLDEIEKIAKALKAQGIKKDDIVASSLPGCPEGVFLIYAINKIGAVYCAFDCRSKKREIEEMLKTFEPKICFVPSFQIKEFENVNNHTVVYINITHSLNSLINFGMFTANLFKGRTHLFFKHKNFISYDSFTKTPQNTAEAVAEKNSENLFGYFYTSGTTYGRKSIILTNENVNAAAYQHRIENTRAKEGDSLLNIMPLFTCYSITLAVHNPLSAGVYVNIIPLVKPKAFKKIILREKPNFVTTVPAHWEEFAKDDFTNCDLSFLKAAAVGGDVMDSTIKKRVNEIFAKSGCPYPLVIGYGLSETTSTATSGMLATSQESVGKPLINTMVKTYDSESDSFLPPFEKGEICIHGPTVCKGYYNDKKMTDSLLKVHKDGKVWLHSGDYGYVDDKGEVYFCQRIKRMYVRFDGTKISPYDIEKALSLCSAIERCMVVTIQDKNHSHGKCAKALIVLNKNTDKASAQNMVKKFIDKEIDEHMRPDELVFVESLPYTKFGKLDYFGAQQEQASI